MMQLAIVQNPHIESDEDRRALWDRLYQMLDGDEYVEREPELDTTSMESLKAVMSQNPRIIVK